MRTTYIVTGAAGHLGGTIVRLLSQTGQEVRALSLAGETQRARRGVTWYTGDIRRPESLRALFSGLDGRDICVIHAAGVVDISGEMSARMRDVNVEGTKNVIALCRAFNVRRLVYVSSVHAIPEREDMGVMREIRAFSPDAVTGGYAKTKAEATQAVLDAAVKRVTVQADALLVELEELPLCFRVRAQAGGRGAARRVEVTECTPLPR